MKKIIPLLFIVLGGCTVPNESNYIRQVSSWLGRTPEELVTQWGEPTQVIPNQGNLYYIYMTKKDIELNNIAADGGTNEENAIYPLENLEVSQANLFCQTTFVIQNGLITNWAVEGDDCVAY